MTIHQRRPTRMTSWQRGLFAGLLFLVPTEAFADGPERQPLRLHGEGGLSVMLSTPHSSRFENGANATARLGVDIAGPLSLQASVANLWMPAHEGERGRMYTLEGGLRASFSEGKGLLGGPVIDINAGVGFTGDLRRAVIDPGVGWEFVFSDWIAGGPMLRYMQIVQPASAPQPDDARLFLAGIGLTFGVPIRATVTTSPDEQPMADDFAKRTEPEVASKEPEPPEPVVEQEPSRTASAAPEPSTAPSATKLKEEVHFALGKAQFGGADNSSALSDVCEQLREDENKKLRISGHADETGNPLFNQGLAAQRAATVAQWVMKNCDLPASRVEIAAHGDSRPVCTDNSSDCYAKNRRVEFELIDP